MTYRDLEEKRKCEAAFGEGLLIGGGMIFFLASLAGIAAVLTA